MASIVTQARNMIIAITAKNVMVKVITVQSPVDYAMPAQSGHGVTLSLDLTVNAQVVFPMWASHIRLPQPLFAQNW